MFFNKRKTYEIITFLHNIPANGKNLHSAIAEFYIKSINSYIREVSEIEGVNVAHKVSPEGNVYTSFHTYTELKKYFLPRNQKLKKILFVTKADKNLQYADIKPYLKALQRKHKAENKRYKKGIKKILSIDCLCYELEWH
jgi:hypothetical protein